jgi:hypothetical protein
LRLTALMDPISASMAGLYTASARFDRASRRVVESTSTGRGDAVSALVEQKQAELAFAANAATFRTTARAQQRLLDIMV